MRHGLVFSVSALLCLGAAISAGADDPAPVRAALVADQSRLQPGERILLGALLDLEPGWHVYWRNPGEAGLSTQLTVTMPTGISRGEVQWPLPITFEQPGGIIGFGYEESVLLAFEVEAPPQFESADLTYQISLSWLACKDRCIVGSATLDGDLGNLPKDVAAFDAWKKRLPRPSGEGVVAATTSPGSETNQVVLWLQWQSPPAAVQFFPEPIEGLEIIPTRVQSRAGLTRIDLRVRPLSGGPATIQHIDSLVVAQDSEGARRGYPLRVELLQGDKQ